MRILSAYLIGLVFGTGIAISGMANPAKVLNFFDVAGDWDASLLFVMGGALGVTALGYRFVLGRRAPVLAADFHLPGNRAIDARLLGGATLFGVGWGLSGFCPGGVLPVIGTGRSEVLLFIAAMLAGIYVARRIQAAAPASGVGLASPGN